MGIVNRRNALIGWVVVKAAKRSAKKKAKGAVPSAPEGPKSRAAIAAGVATFFGVLTFWKRRRSSDGE